MSETTTGRSVKIEVYVHEDSDEAALDAARHIVWLVEQTDCVPEAIRDAYVLPETVEAVTIEHGDDGSYDYV